MEDTNSMEISGENPSSSEEILSIPVADNEVIEVKVDELPDEAKDLIEIFVSEHVPLGIWLRFARTYYKQGRQTQFLDILTAGSASEILEAYKDDPDAVHLLHTLASYYIQKAAEQTEESKDNFVQAVACFNIADKIDQEQWMAFVGKGMGHLLQKDYDAAMHQFDTALDMQANNVPALLAQASIHYNTNNYEKSLQVYSRVVKVCPSAPAAVRLGIAMCHYKLGRVDACRRAFERVLELDDTCADALGGLAVIELNSEGSGALANGLKLLERAYKSDPRHPIVLNQLASHFFYRQDYAKVLKFASLAYHIAKSPELKAESAYLIGRTHHKQGDFEKAFQFYSQADQHSQSYLPVAYGLGQMYIFKQEFQKAIQCFMKIEKQFPNDRDTMKILAILHAHSPETTAMESAVVRLKKYIELHPDDVEVYIELAQLSEKTQPAESLNAYEKAVKLFEGQELPAALWNNIGAVRHRMSGNQAERLMNAGVAYGRAMQANGAAIDNFGSKSVTTVYNIARLHEDAKQYEKAAELYRAILAKYPKYIDCLLRLGMMAQNQGSKDEAMSLYKEAIGIDETCADAWILFGNLHLKYEEWLQAQRKYEHVLNKIDNRDSYSLVSLGNIFYYTSLGVSDKRKARRSLDHALRYFTDVLKHDAYNVAAACGAGIILAERGKLSQAREVLHDVCQVADSQPTWLNVAHMYLARGQFKQAITTYYTLLKRFGGGRNPWLLVVTAKALYEAGELSECVTLLQKAIHIAPHDPSIRFNLALAKKEYGRRTLRDPSSSSKQCEAAAIDLQQASAIFGYLGKNIPARTVHTHEAVDPVRASSLDRGLSSILTEVDSILLDKRAEEEQMERRKMELQRELGEKEKERLQVEEAAREEIAEQERREKELEEALKEKHHQILSEQHKSISVVKVSKKQVVDNEADKSEAKPPGEKKGRKRRKNEGLSIEDIEREMEEDERRREKGAGDVMADIFGDEESEEGDGVNDHTVENDEGGKEGEKESEEEKKEEEKKEEEEEGKKEEEKKEEEEEEEEIVHRVTKKRKIIDDDD